MPHSLEPSDAWMAPSRAARLAGVSVGRIRELIDEGKLRTVQTDLGRLIRRIDVETYKQAREARLAAKANDPRPAA